MKKICYLFLAFVLTSVVAAQNRTAKIAVIQASGLPVQDPFLENYEPALVRPQMMAHFNKLLGLFEEAGKMGADLVCGPEDMQHIGSYGLHIDKNDIESGKVLFSGLAIPVPSPMTDHVADIARRYKMYVIAPIYETEGENIYNTALVFDREGKIIGKHRKTLMPVLETWLVTNGDAYEVFETDFAKIAIATCWELFFPEITSIYALKGADIVFNPTMGKDNIPGKGLETAHMFITRARDNSVYIAPVILGQDGNGIIDFDGKVIAEAVGQKDVVIMAEIDFSKERIAKSDWWRAINGTDNVRALHLKSRRPELNKILADPNPPLMERYQDIHLTTGDRDRQLKAVHEVDYSKQKK